MTPQISDRALLILLAAITALGPIATNLYIPALPSVREYFDASVAAVQATFSISVITFAFGILAWGPFADRYGRRTAVLSGLAIMVAGSLVSLTAQDLGRLVAGRGIQAFGTATGIVVARAIVSDRYPVARMSKVLAQLTMVAVLGNSLAPVLGGFLAAGLGWRAIFGVLIATSAAIGLAAWRWLPETRPHTDRPPHAREMAAAAWSLLRMPMFAGCVAQSTVVYATFLVFISLAPYVMVAALGRPTTEFGFYYLFIAAGYFLGNWSVHRFMARHDLHWMVVTGVLLSAIGAVTALVDRHTNGSPRPLADGRILFTQNSLVSPVELFTVATAGGTPQRITDLNRERLAGLQFGEESQFSFTGAHGDTVYGYLIEPVGFDPAKRYPLAFLIHGGPQGSFDDSWHYRWNPQIYAAHGYATVMIDFHGSTGYGQAFTDAIAGDWGGKPYEDLVKGFDFVLGKYPFLDGTRACALGASYGGYMINWIAGQPLADRFKCLVSHDGNIDERSAYFMTEELWFPEWEHGGTPWDNPQGFAKHNPVDFVKNWKTPTLVIHGQKDYRVVYSQGLGTFTALQRKGIPSKLLFFPDENHWVLKPANSIQWHETVLGWLDEWTRK